jgi:Domain of unknown function (DUF4190)
MNDRGGEMSQQSVQVVQPSAGTNGKAIASLVLGIVGLTGIPFVASIVAIALGYMARSEVQETGQSGGGLATAGIILGWVGLILVIAFVGVFFSFITVSS